MNEKQKWVLIATAAVILGMLLFPPFHVTGTGEGTINFGYSWILNPPYYRATVNIAMLITQWIGVLIVGGIAYFLLKGR